MSFLGNKTTKMAQTIKGKVTKITVQDSPRINYIELELLQDGQDSIVVQAKRHILTDFLTVGTGDKIEVIIKNKVHGIHNNFEAVRLIRVL